MRRWIVAIVLLSAATLAAQAPGPVTLASILESVAEDLGAVPEQDRSNTAYIVFWPGDDKTSTDHRRVLRWWVSQMSFERGWIPPAELHGGRAWRIDLRDYRWTPDAWRAVAERDPYFQQPFIPDALANRLRSGIGYVPKSKSGSLPVVAAVRADWLFRETIETNRSPAYYDLLFAAQRHPGSANAAARATLKLPPKADNSNFPKDEADWDDAFGVKEVNAFLSRQRINLAAGAVVAGSVDDPAKGSIVARNNRLLWFVPIPTGAAMKTFDVADTGKHDFLETSPELPAGKVPYDAGELLAHLPNGGLASFLIDGAGTRIERGDIDVVHNKVDPRFADVRNPMGCVTCHTAEGGFISPRNLVEDMLKSGVDVKIKDRATRNLYRSFFLEWDDRFKSMRTPYERLIDRTTAEPGQPAWKPAQLVAAFTKFRDQYDDPVTIKAAAAELDTTEAKLKLALTRSPGARLNMLLRGVPVPRRSWESGLYAEASKLLHLEK